VTARPANARERKRPAEIRRDMPPRSAELKESLRPGVPHTSGRAGDGQVNARRLQRLWDRWFLHGHADHRVGPFARLQIGRRRESAGMSTLRGFGRTFLRVADNSPGASARHFGKSVRTLRPDMTETTSPPGPRRS
jgi:hypothetical protein